MTLKEQQQEFARMVGRLLVYLTEQHIPVRFGDAWRSTDPLAIPHVAIKYTYQELLVHNGKSKVKSGKHNDRLAVDLIMESDAHYRVAGEFWEKMGGRWGGRFGVKVEDYKTKLGWDAGHFEL